MRLRSFLPLCLAAVLFQASSAASAADYDPETGTFLNYHQLTAALHEVAATHPSLVKLYSLGPTREGRELWAVEIAAEPEGSTPRQYRPAYLGTGTHHASELSGSMECLYLARYLTNQYGKDRKVTTLLDKQVVYLIPRVAMDGSDYVLKNFSQIRSRQVYIRAPNVVFPEDLNGDGKILRMIWQTPNGRYKRSPADPRLLVPRGEGDTEGPFYQETDEGLVHDWDGGPVAAYNRIARFRVDFNRTYPWNWSPFYSWIGFPKIPLGEPETKAVADFVLDHPNIQTASDYHTGNPVIWYPSGAMADRSEFPEDVQLFEKLGRRAAELTGYPYGIGYQPSHADIPGFFTYWLYEHLGILAYTMEMGIYENFINIDTSKPGYNRSNGRDGGDLNLLKWDDAHDDVKLFFDWRSFDHPQLGEVEIGGWNPVLTGNPPPHVLDTVCERLTQFMLEHASHAPELTWENVTAQPAGNDTWRVRGSLRNIGPADTHVTKMAQKLNPFSKINVEVTPAQGKLDLVEGRELQEIDPLPARSGRTELEWVVRTTSPELTLVAKSERGLYAKKTVALKP